MIDKLRQLVTDRRPTLYAILDIGTVEVKALIIFVMNGQGSIIGIGRQPHETGAIVGGAIADAALASQACERALVQAESMTETIAAQKLVADRVVLDVAAPLLKSVCLNLTVKRPRPQDRINESELRSIMQRAERLVLQQARAETAAGSGKAVADAELVDADVLHIFIDGHLVNNALGATGAQVDVRLSNVVAPASCLSAVEALAAGLDLQTVAVRSGLCTLARTPHLVARGDSIIVDIGGECTGVLLARGGGIEAVRSFPIGGASFTRLVSRTLGVPHLAAEDIKRTYASRRLDEMRTAELSAAFAGEIPTWLEGLRSCLDAMAGRDNLPAQIHITGGGAALGDLVQAVRAYPWLRTLRFARQPQATVVQPRLAAHISDRTRQINSHSFSVPLALAGWFVQSLHQTEANSAQRALTQVLHGMDLL